MDPSQEIGRDGKSKPYKGVRKRAWGKWVSEIRVPRTGKRIWLGSYDAPEKAARAYDAALYCIRGERGSFNFPADKKPQLPWGSSLQTLSKKDIQTIATSFASSEVSVSSSASHAASSVTLTTQVPTNDLVSPGLPALPLFTDSFNTPELVGEPFVPLGVNAESTTSIEDLELDDFLMMDIEWISDLF